MNKQFNLKKSRYELVRVLREEFGIHNSKAWSIMKRVEEQDGEFIRLLKEGDLYRELVNEYGKVKVWSCNADGICDLIEEYYKKKIDKLAKEFKEKLK